MKIQMNKLLWLMSGMVMGLTFFSLTQASVGELKTEKALTPTQTGLAEYSSLTTRESQFAESMDQQTRLKAAVGKVSYGKPLTKTGVKRASVSSTSGLSNGLKSNGNVTIPQYAQPRTEPYRPSATKKSHR